jgi:hypothetical protein
VAFYFAFWTRFAFVFCCWQALQVKNRPKSIRGFFWLQEEQNWSVGSPVPVGPPIGEPVFVTDPAGLQHQGLGTAYIENLKVRN